MPSVRGWKKHGVPSTDPPLVRLLIPLASLSILAAGCTPSAVVRDAPAGDAAGYPNHSAEQIVEAMNASVARVRSYRAESRLDAQRGGRAYDLGTSIRARLSDSLVAIVRGPLGIEGGRALVTADSFFAIDRLNARLYLGAASAAEEFIPGAGDRGRLARALLGLDVPAAGPGWTVRPANGRYIMVAPGGTQTWTVDPRYWRAASVVEVAADGRRVSRTYSEFGVVDGHVFPQRVVLASPSDGAQLTIEHRDVTFNPADLRLSFSPSDDLEVVRVGR
jgi:hypothetical protein